MRAFIIVHFQEDQTKYPPSQTHMCIYIYIYVHIYIKRTDPRPQAGSCWMDDQLSLLWGCQFWEITPWKN